MKYNKRLLKKAALIALCLCAAAVVFDIASSRKHGILYGTAFSGAYTDKHGVLLKMYLTPDEKYRMYKPVSAYPASFLEALLLQEDKHFFTHHGINPLSLIRAGWQTYFTRSRRVGASTITMQTAKLKYRLYTRNLGGKLLQMFLALRLELLYSKQDILNAYVNLAPCGKNIEGFAAASQYFFGKSIEKTTLSEQLMLCVLPQNPSQRCPSFHYIPQELTNAKLRLFEKWVEEHPDHAGERSFITAAPQLTCAFPETALHFTRMLELSRSTRHTATPQPAVRTSIDGNLQNISRRTLERYVQQQQSAGITNAAALLLNWQTMEIEAAVGSAGFYRNDIQGQVDANTSKRSPGSALKPFVYALALDQGLIHYGTMLKDTPSSFSAYTPDNYGNSFKGPIKAWNALTQSRNIPALDLARRLNAPGLYELLVKAGISGLKDKDHYGLSLVLGSADTTPFELVRLYAALKNKGLMYPVKTVQSSPETPQQNNGIPLFSEQAAFIVCKMLEQNPPPVQSLLPDSAPLAVGYKTGTSIGFKDCWTAGFFGQYVLCVWIGNFDGSGNNAFLGRTAAAPLFFSIAGGIIADGSCTVQYNPPPEGVKKITVCAVSGALPSPVCPHTEEAWFISGVSPIDRCRIHREITVDTRTGYRTDEKNAPYSKTLVREFWTNDMLRLFEQAGLPRLKPPVYPPKNRKTDISRAGFPPKIISPLRNTVYVLRKSAPEKKRIILQAVTDADTLEVFWFSGSTFITRVSPSEKYEWQPPSQGAFDLTVVDTKGRSDSRKVTVEITE